MNLPNKLTVGRIILVPLMVVVSILSIDIQIKNYILALIFLIGSLTDYVDGNIARKRNIITDFGKFLDPLADKILVLSAMMILLEQGKIPSWIPIIVIIREFAVSGYRLVASTKGGKVIPASIWGKIKTMTQMVAILLIFVMSTNFFEGITNATYLTQLQIIINIVASILLIVSTIATIFSGYDYLKNMNDLIDIKE